MAEQSKGILGALQNRFARLVGRPTAEERVREEEVVREIELFDRVSEHAAARLAAFEASPTAKYLRDALPVDAPPMHDELVVLTLEAEHRAIEQTEGQSGETKNDFDMFFGQHLGIFMELTLMNASPRASQEQDRAFWEQATKDLPESWSNHHRNELFDIQFANLVFAGVDLTGLDQEAVARFEEQRAAVLNDATSWLYASKPEPDVGGSLFDLVQQHAFALMKERVGLDFGRPLEVKPALEHVEQAPAIAVSPVAASIELDPSIGTPSAAVHAAVAAPAPAAAPVAAAAAPVAVAAAPVERAPTGVWDDFPTPHAGKVEQFWRDRYATTNVAMSPIDNAPDGFPISATGERSLGFFDAQAQRKALAQDHTTFRELDVMFKERAELLDENIKRANGPDKVRLELLSKAERTSFEAESASFLRGKPRYDELLDKSREHFTALMDYDRLHNHPISNPDRQMSLAKPSPQEQFNWLHRQDDGHAARTAPQRPGWMPNEHDELVMRHNILQTVAQPRPTETAPLEIRNAMKQELNERIAATKALTAEQAEAKQAVADYLKTVAPPTFEAEPDVKRGNYVRGTLVENGVRHYKDDPKNRPSPFAVVEDRGGDRHTVWGVDLPRAIGAGGVQNGETVELRNLGKQPVLVTDPKTGRQVTSERVEWAALPHDSVKHEAEQRAKHDAAHPVALRDIEASVSNWLTADRSDASHYIPLKSAAALEQTNVALPDQAVAIAKDLRAEQVQGVQAAKVVPPAEPTVDLTADAMDKAIGSIKIAGFAHDGKVASYTMSLGDQEISGTMRWDPENHKLEGVSSSAALDGFANGPRIDHALGGPVSSEDREYFQAAMSEYLESSTRDFVKEHGYELAPVVAAIPTLSGLGDRLAARETAAQTEQDGKSQGAGEQALSDGPAIAAPAPVQNLEEKAPVQAAAADVEPAVQAKATVVPSLESLGAKLDAAAQVEQVAPIEMPEAEAVQAGETVPIEMPKVEAVQAVEPEVERNNVAPKGLPSLNAVGAKLDAVAVVEQAPAEQIVVAPPSRRIDVRMNEHQSSVREIEATSERLSIDLGATGPAVEQAQRQRLGIGQVNERPQDLEQGQTQSLNIPRRRM